MERKDTKTAAGATLPHIQCAEEIKDEQLAKVVTRPDAKSITRTITPVKLKFVDENEREEEAIVVDTPGMGDTESPEIDISNAFNILKAARKASTIRPVLIFSYKNVGGRFELLPSQLLQYVSLVKNLKKALPSFTYLFTSFPDVYNTTMSGFINELKA